MLSHCVHLYTVDKIAIAAKYIVHSLVTWAAKLICRVASHAVVPAVLDYILCEDFYSYFVHSINGKKHFPRHITMSFS